MYFTGIVRRIDDLGRVVIPKDIRKAFCLHENDTLEVWVDTKEMIIGFHKYNEEEEQND